MDCTILVPTYYGGDLTLQCVKSLLNKVSGAKIMLYKNEIGWVKACNDLMKSVTTDVLLMNDDTVALTDLVQEMSTLAYSDPAIGIVGGKSLAPDQSTITNFGIYIGTDGNSAHKHYGQQRAEVTEPEYQKAVEGSCIFIKREVLDKIGYFDEEFGMGYREEVDECFRAREAGYKVISCPTAAYVHFGSQTMAKLGITNDSYGYFMEKWGRKLKLGIV